jgi:hypothetical protein
MGNNRIKHGSIIRDFLCWLLGHNWNRSHARGWSGHVDYQCQRCRRHMFSQFDF